MYEVHILSKQLEIPEKEVLLCLFSQDFELSHVAVCMANQIMFDL